MKCYTVDGSGLDGLKFDERPAPGKPGRGDVLVEVHAVSLNYRDLMVAKGQYGGDSGEAIIACSDMAGIVREIGPGVTELAVGDRVVNAPFRFWPAGKMRSDWIRTFVGGAGVDGVLAEEIIYPAVSLVPVPEHMTLIEGSTLTIAGLTAWAAMVTFADTKPGEWVLLHGTGGVSIFGAQIAKLLGARTIMSTSNDAKGKYVKEQFQVDEVIDYRDAKWPDRVREITGNAGVDVVVEVAGGESLPRSIGVCDYGGRVAVIGVLGGVESKLNVIDLLYRQVTVRGILMDSTENLRALARAFEVGKITPQIDRVFAFNDVRGAYDYLQSQKHIGKVAVEVRKK